MAKANAKGKKTSQPDKKAWNTPNARPPKGMSQEQYGKLVAESKAPYKGFRKVIYASAGTSGAIGGFVFLTKILAGRDVAQSLSNLAVQIGVVAITVFLFRWEDREKKDK